MRLLAARPQLGVQVGTTFRGAGVIRGDLSPECAAVQAVLEALGKRHGRKITVPRASGSTTRCSRAARCCPASAALGLAGVASRASVRVPHGPLRYGAYTIEV